MAAGYYLGAHLGFALTLAPVPVSTLWPPNAILLSGLLLTTRNRWPAIFGAVLVAHLAVQFQSGVPVGMLLCWYLSNCTEALLGAFILRTAGPVPPTFETLRGVSVFLAAAITAPFLSSFLDAGFVQLNGWGAADYWTVWSTRFCSNVLATVTLVPVIVTAAAALRHGEHLSRRAIVEATVGLVALITVLWLVFAARLTGPGASPALLYSPLPLLVAAAVRFGPLGVSIAMLACSLIAISGAGHGLGPFVSHSPRDNALAIQLFLVVVWMPVMALAALIRERSVAEAKARASEEQLTMALDAAQLGRWEWDIASDRLSWSDGTRRIYEVPAGLPVSRDTFDTMIHPDDRAVVAAITAEAATGRSFDLEFRIVLPGGRVKWIHSKGKSICDPDGVPQRMIGIKADVTRTKEADLRLHEQRQKLALSARHSVAGELSVALAHELNQPLAAIMANAGAARQFLRHDPPNLQELSDIVEAIAYDDRRAAEVISRLASSLRSGGPRQSLVDMNEIVATVLEVARGDLLSRGVSVTRQLAPLPRVMGDSVQLQQALLNLIFNGCDAMDLLWPGERQLSIATAVGTADEVTVTVSDTGPGVSEDRVLEIFEPFVTSYPQRLGLGLAICRSIVSAHDGRLWVQRTAQGGAAFWLAFPAARIDAKVEPSSQQPAGARG